MVLKERSALLNITWLFVFNVPLLREKGKDITLRDFNLSNEKIPKNSVFSLLSFFKTCFVKYLPCLMFDKVQWDNCYQYVTCKHKQTARIISAGIQRYQSAFSWYLPFKFNL